MVIIDNYSIDCYCFDLMLAWVPAVLLIGVALCVGFLVWGFWFNCVVYCCVS